MTEQTCKLRDMTEGDIENYVRWFTVETEFNDWDAPWEPIETTEEEERKSWKEYLDWTSTLSSEDIRQKFEIEWNGRHVGWVCCYRDLEYLENPRGILALGIDIPEISARNKGCGMKALELFMDYLQGFGHHSFYLQTWSGNLPMLRLAEKLGFREVCRKENLRRVQGKSYDAITLELRRETCGLLKGRERKGFRWFLQVGRLQIAPTDSIGNFPNNIVGAHPCVRPQRLEMHHGSMVPAQRAIANRPYGFYGKFSE